MSTPARVGGTPRLIDRAPVVIGTARFRVPVEQLADFCVQWVMHEATGVASSVRVYLSTGSDEDTTNLNPATNPWWYLPPGGTFPAAPNGAIGSVILPFADNAVRWAMVEVNVTTALTRFSLVLWGRNR